MSVPSSYLARFLAECASLCAAIGDAEGEAHYTILREEWLSPFVESYPGEDSGSVRSAVWS